MAFLQSQFAAAAGAELLDAIRSAGRAQRFTQGEAVPVAGLEHPGGPILMIRNGFVSTVAIAESGQRTLLSIHSRGDLVGEQVLFGAPSAAYGQVVTGMSDGSAWCVQPERFRKILQHHPRGWEALARDLHSRMAAADERICLMAGATAGRRLAVFLLQLLSHERPRRGRNDQTHQVPLELSQSDLAEWVGVSRETVERVLSGWVGRGIVRTGRRSLLVLNIAHLQRIAGLRPDATGHAA